ncbi:MAG TPA: MFS transporter [Actinomycetota bacterium]|nr:MFS transporter [Actinomycetota bacterium]
MLGFEGDDAREKVAVLLTMCFALAMAMLDNTVVNVAIPTITRELSAGVSEIQWIIDGYVLAFASLLLTGGITGDRYGRKKVFLIGLTIFTIASLLCGLSQTSTQLILARALQGVGAAFLMPGTLSIITVTFPPEERAKAIGLWAGVSGLALALGPTLGGYMVEHVGWESVFFLNVPIGIVAFAIATRTVRESRSEHARSLDLPGLLLGTVGLLALTYGLIEANTRGWSDPVIVAALGLAAGLLAAFLLWEGRNPNAMLPLSFFRIPSFAAGNTVAFSVSLGMFSIFLFFSLYMQLVRGHTPFEAGLRFLPMTLMIIVTAPNAGRIASKIGSRAPMTYGLLLVGGGLLAMTLVEADTPYWMLAILYAIMGHGIGSTMAPMTAAVMNSVGRERAGLGSATTNTSREVGGVLGIALLGTILFSQLSSAIAPLLADTSLSAGQQRAVIEIARHGVPGAEQLAPLGLSASQGLEVVGAFREAYMSGFRVAIAVAACVMLAAAFVANRFIPGRSSMRAAADAPAPGEPVVAH